MEDTSVNTKPAISKASFYQHDNEQTNNKKRTCASKDHNGVKIHRAPLFKLNEINVTKCKLSGIKGIEGVSRSQVTEGRRTDKE